jgi:hypothetical protein
MTTAPEPCCAHHAPRPRPSLSRPRLSRAARPSRLSWGAFASGVALALLPKCPLCLAAYLTVLGVGTGAAASLARLLHPLAASIAAVVLAVFVLRLARRAQRFAQARVTGA